MQVEMPHAPCEQPTQMAMAVAPQRSIMLRRSGCCYNSAGLRSPPVVTPCSGRASRALMPVLQQHAAADGCVKVQAHAGGSAFAAGAAGVVKPQPAALPLSAVEAAVPGSFCAELWRGVSTGPSSIFRCGWPAMVLGSGGLTKMALWQTEI